MSIWKQTLLGLAILLAGLAGMAVFVPKTHDTLRALGLGPVLDSLGLAAASGPGEAGGGNGWGSDAGQPPPEVLARPPGEGLVADTVSAIGDGQALRSVTVFARTPGRVSRILVNSGQAVKAGDILLQLDDEAEIIARERARLVLDDARTSLARADQLRASGTGTDVQQREADLRLRQAELELRQAEFDLEQRVVTVPVSGQIGILNAEVGAQIGTQTEIARIDDRSILLIDFRLPERMVGRIAIGKAVQATALAGGSGPFAQSFTGEISAIDNRVDPANRTLRVQARLDNSADLLRAGMAFAITMDLPGEPASAVDPLSVQWSREGAYVWVVRDGKSLRLPVHILQRNEKQVMVLAQFQPGDLVIVEGVQSVRPDAPVTLRNAGAAAADGGGASSDAAPAGQSQP